MLNFLFICFWGWTPWSSWSSCSETCGYGSQTRNRQCSGDCSQVAVTDQKNCQDKPCKLNNLRCFLLIFWLFTMEKINLTLDKSTRQILMWNFFFICFCRLDVLVELVNLQQDMWLWFTNKKPTMLWRLLTSDCYRPAKLSWSTM